MARARKFSGKTVDEATEIALAELGAELEDVDIRVVNPGRSGILGFGGEPAEIEVALLSAGESLYDDDVVDESSEETSETETERESRGRGRGRNRNRGRGRGRNGRHQDKREESTPAATSASSDEPEIEGRDEEAEQLVAELIDYFLGAMGVVADTYIREDEDDPKTLTFEIEGQDAGLLIGRRGETLQALQFVVRMVTNRQLGRKAYVVIDVEDYRERRSQMLRRLARRTAGRVASSGREDSLDPMSPAERRIVHMSLAGHPDVRTESEGEGNQRRVVIFPK
jgi:spoIIIJ-associated protein